MTRKRRSSSAKTMASKRRRGQRSTAPSSSSSMDDASEWCKTARTTSLQLELSTSSNNQRADGTDKPTSTRDYFSNLSLEMICQILDYLPVWDVVKMECQCHHLQEAVNLHLQLVTDIDFTEGVIHGWMPSRFTDCTLKHFLKRCPELVYIYGLHMEKVNRRRQRGCDSLSVPGMIDALQQCENLMGVETSNIFLLEAVLTYLPYVEVMGTFKNRDATFPIPPQNSISLVHGARLTSLHLSGVELRDLPPMYFLKQLHLKWVRFTDPNPFRDFEMPRLRSFIMNNCAGPQSALKYLPLMTGLATATGLKRLELVRVPFLGGLIYHVVEDSWRVSGFRNLAKFKIGACKHVQEADLGYLMIASKNKLEELYIQPSLTRDNFFYSLIHADVDFAKLHTLHLGYVDDFPEPGKWTQEELVANGLADYAENPAFVTDFGMKCAADVFIQLTQLKLYNCPQVYNPTSWITGGNPGLFSHLTDLHLRRCHAVKLSDCCTFITMLPNLEHLYMENMFKEPPKGCSRVGLSAGLGVSSALAGGGHSADNQNLLNPLANQHVSMQQAANNNQPANVSANQESDSEDDQRVDCEGAFDVQDDDMEAGDNAEDSEHLADNPAPLNPSANQCVYKQREASCVHSDDVQLEGDHRATQTLKQPASGQEQSSALGGTESSGSHSGLDKPDKLINSASKSGESGRDDDNNDVGTIDEMSGHGQARHQMSTAQEQHVELDGYVWNCVEGPSDLDQGLDGGTINYESGVTNNSSDSDEMFVGERSLDDSHVDKESGSEQNADLGNDVDVMFGPCEQSSSKRITHNEASHSSVGGQSSKGKLLKNRSIACYPKGRSRWGIEKSAKSSGESSSGDVKNGPDQPIDGPLDDGVITSSQQAVCITDVNKGNEIGDPYHNNSHPEENQQGKIMNQYHQHCSSFDKPNSLVDLDPQVDIKDRCHPSSAKNVGQKPDLDETALNVHKGPNLGSHSGKQFDPPEKKLPQGSPRPGPDKLLQGSSKSGDCKLPQVSPKSDQDELARGSRKSGQDKLPQVSPKSDQNKSPQGSLKSDRGELSQDSLKSGQDKFSTQDQQIEDDYPQVFVVKSNSLLSLNLHYVGITDIIITDCRKLSSLTVSGCRVLKNVNIDKAPLLAQSSFVQCPKIRYEDVVDEICQLPPEEHRIIYLRPVGKYDGAKLEQQLLSTKTYRYHICLLHDHSPDPEQTLYNRIRVTSWPDVITSVNCDLIRVHKHPEVTELAEVISNQYPWRQGVYRMQGTSDNGSEWDLICDVPWIETLASDEDRINQSWIYSDNRKVGVYSPSGKGHCCLTSAEKRLQDKIEGIRQLKRPLYLHPVIIYVNLCDLNGIVPDKYA